MRILKLAAAAALLLSLAPLQAAYAQGASPGGPVIGGTAVEKPTAGTTTRRTRAARPTREPTVGQMAARERQRKCGAEWKEAKAAGKTAGQKWPQFWSRCNARLKGNAA